MTRRLAGGMFGAALLALGACSSSDSEAMGDRAIQGLLQCREQFTSTLKSLGATGATLDPGQRYQLVSAAILQRQQCEELPIRQANAYLAKED